MPCPLSLSPYIDFGQTSWASKNVTLLKFSKYYVDYIQTLGFNICFKTTSTLLPTSTNQIQFNEGLGVEEDGGESEASRCGSGPTLQSQAPVVFMSGLEGSWETAHSIM